MKRIISLLIAVLMLCALCVPASAASEITVYQTTTNVMGDCIISKPGEYETERLTLYNGSKLTVDMDVTLKVTGSISAMGEIELLGTLDLSQCSSCSSNMSINIGLTGELIYDPEVIIFTGNITGPGRITTIENSSTGGNTNLISDDTDAGLLTVKEDTAISGSHTYSNIEVSGSEVYPNNIITPCTLTVESGAAITSDSDFSLKNGCSATIKSGASVTCGYNFNVNDGSSVTIESGASVTCDLFQVKDGSSVTIESGASVTCSRFVVKSGSSVTVKSGASVTCDDLDISGFGSGRVMVLENGASITVNSYVDIGDSAFLGISGILTGKCTGFTGNVTLSPGGTVDLEAANGNVANKLVAQLQQYEEGAKAEQNSDGSYRVTAHRHVYAEEGTCCAEEYLKNIASGDTASTLSEGSMAIVVGIAGVAVGMAVMFFIMKKKPEERVES